MKRLIFFLFFLTTSLFGWAQNLNSNGKGVGHEDKEENGDHGNWPNTPAYDEAYGHKKHTDEPIPFDGGLSVLIGAGLAYGIKRHRDQTKKSN